jgi:hypothetical protein
MSLGVDPSAIPARGCFARPSSSSPLLRGRVVISALSEALLASRVASQALIPEQMLMAMVS